MSVGDRGIFPKKGPEQIRNRQFVWVRKGYDPEQVQEFLSQLADSIDSMESELRSARDELASASRQKGAARDEAYGELAKRMADMLQSADHHAEGIRKEAEDEAAKTRNDAAAESERARKEATGVAERTKAEAEADAARIRKEAQAESERLVREASAKAEQLKRENDEAMRKARTEAEHIVGVLSTRRDMLVQEVQATRERLLGVLDKVGQAVPPPPAPVISGPQGGSRPGGKDAPSKSGDASKDESLDLVLPKVPKLEEEVDS